MTDKEQIIINGVNVSKCKYLRGDYCDLHMENEFLCHCEDYPDCYFKQLANKTQECEELKAYAQRQENQREEYYKEYLKLSQECEELKGEIKGLKDYIKWIMHLQ